MSGFDFGTPDEFEIGDLGIDLVVTVWAMLSGNATGLSENQPRQYPLAGVGQDYPGDGGQSYPAPPAQAYPITADQSYPLAGVVQSYPGQAA